MKLNSRKEIQTVTYRIEFDAGELPTVIFPRTRERHVFSICEVVFTYKREDGDATFTAEIRGTYPISPVPVCGCCPDKLKTRQYDSFKYYSIQEMPEFLQLYTEVYWPDWWRE